MCSVPLRDIPQFSIFIDAWRDRIRRSGYGADPPSILISGFAPASIISSTGPRTDFTRHHIASLGGFG
jgi:hypothetical protein